MSILRQRLNQQPFRRLAERFDADELRRQTTEIIARFGLGAERLQLCLTSRPTSQDRLTDGAGSLLGRGTEDEFTVLNEEFSGTIFEDIYHRVPFRLGRVRLMALQPRSCYTFHEDSEPRLHIAITTNEQASLLVQSGPNYARVHIPADGSLWWVDTMRTHNAINGGNTIRVHWVAAIVDENSLLPYKGPSTDAD